MDSWGWAILLAAVTAVAAMLLMALYDEISRRKWLAKSGAERLSASHSLLHKKIRLSACVPCPPGSKLDEWSQYAGCERRRRRPQTSLAPGALPILPVCVDH